MLKIIASLFLVSTALFGSVKAADTDIVVRTINFLIFAGILYYLLANKIKAFFGDRSTAIEMELQKVQDRLKETKMAKQNAAKGVEDAKRTASDILSVSKKENAILNERIVKQMDQDLKSLDTQHQTLISFEQRTMVGTVVEEIMDDVLSDSNIPLDDELITQIMLKKVA